MEEPEEIEDHPTWLKELRSAFTRAVHPATLKAAMREQCKRAEGGDLAATRFIVDHARQVIAEATRREEAIERKRKNLRDGKPLEK